MSDCCLTSLNFPNPDKELGHPRSVPVRVGSPTATAAVFLVLLRLRRVHCSKWFFKPAGQCSLLVFNSFNVLSPRTTSRNPLFTLNNQLLTLQQAFANAQSPNFTPGSAALGNLAGVNVGFPGIDLTANGNCQRYT